eukprot:12899194-Prorocentrum_lima.AAC.1
MLATLRVEPQQTLEGEGDGAGRVWLPGAITAAGAAKRHSCGGGKLAGNLATSCCGGGGVGGWE